jgi:hypothetical protein
MQELLVRRGEVHVPLPRARNGSDVAQVEPRAREIGGQGIPRGPGGAPGSLHSMAGRGVHPAPGGCTIQ